MPLMCFWYVRVKMLVAVFAFGVTYYRAILSNENSVLANYLCAEWYVHPSRYTFAAKTFVRGVSHTQKPGANPREGLAWLPLTEPSLRTITKCEEVPARGERSHQETELPVRSCRYLTLLFPAE